MRSIEMLPHLEWAAAPSILIIDSIEM
jgi:hypothetical protein